MRFDELGLMWIPTQSNLVHLVHHGRDRHCGTQGRSLREMTAWVDLIAQADLTLTIRCQGEDSFEGNFGSQPIYLGGSWLV